METIIKYQSRGLKFPSDMLRNEHGDRSIPTYRW